MVALMLEGLPHCATGYQIHHVNCRLATGLEDMGRRPWAKIFPLLRYLLEARRMLRRHPVEVIYYCPGRATLNNALRDLIAFACLRPAVHSLWARTGSRSLSAPVLVLHWHGLGLETGISCAKVPRLLRPCYQLMARPVHALLRRFLRSAQHITLSRWHADVLKARLNVEAAVIPYGIPDPTEQRRQADIPSEQKKLTKDSPPGTRRLLFMSMLTPEKGFHETLEAHRELLRRWLAGEEAHPWRLDLAGSFVDGDGRRAWEAAQSDSILRQAEARAGQTLLHHHGFVGGEAKARLFQQADVFCFPTRYETESFGLVVLEAMAWGVPVVATDWHALPEILGPDYPFLLASDSVPPDSTRSLATLISSASTSSLGPRLRQRFLEHFTASRFHRDMANALHRLTEANAPQPPEM